MIKSFTIESVDSLLSDLIEKARLNSGGTLNKFTKNSTTRGLLYAFASQLSLAKGYIASVDARRYLSSCYGEDLDNYASEYYGETRRGATRSSAEVYVIADTGTVYPQGTQFVSANGVTFQSVEEVTLEDGKNWAFIQVESVDFGSHTKVFANTITSCQNPPTTHISCTNLMAAIGGYDTESDEEFRTRLYSIPHRVSQATPKMLESLVYSLFPAVGKCICEASTYGYCYIGVLKNSGASFTEEECQTIASDLEKYCGYASGMALDVRPLERLNLDLEINVTIANGANFEEVFQQIQIKLLSYLEPRFYTGSSIRGDMLLSRISEIDDIVDIDQTSPAFAQDIPTPHTVIPFIRNLIVKMSKESGEEFQYSQLFEETYYSMFNPNVTSNMQEVL